MTKQIGVHLTFETADLQNTIYTSLGDNIKKKFAKLFSFVPIIVPDASNQIRFNESNKNSFTLSFDSWSTDIKNC